MREITGNRFLNDIGDDNRNGILEENDQPGKNEKLLNNIDYFYKVLAYDEGDYQQPTAGKINAAFTGLSNLVNVMPHSARSEKSPKFTVDITPENQKLIGGLYNFNFFAIDPERTVQYFENHDLELEFQPYWNEYQTLLKKLDPSIVDPTPYYTKFGLYQRNAVLRDLTVNKVLFEGTINFEVQSCLTSTNGLFTENAATYVMRDTAYTDPVTNQILTFGTRNNREIKTRTGHFTSGDFRQEGFCYKMEPPAYGTIGFDFDFTMQQFGGKYRPDSTTLDLAKKEFDCKAETNIGIIDEGNTLDQDMIQTTTLGGIDLSSYGPVPGSFNNGPGEYVVEFVPGGKETMDIVWNGLDSSTQKSNTFSCEYLNLKVTNRLSYNRPNETGGDSVKVDYPGEYPHMDIKTPVEPNNIESQLNTNGRFNPRDYPDPRNIYYGGEDPLNPATNQFIGKFNLAAYPWVNARYSLSPLVLKNQIGRAPELRNRFISYSGKQGKYYLSAISIDGKDTIDFVHILNIGGVQFAFDYANKGRYNRTKQWWAPQKNYSYGPDFKVGDKVLLKTFGGALGMPLPGAKVKIKIASATNAGVSASTLLDQVKVVPNPYYVTHQGQKSPYDTKLFFTKLPKKCTIKIYTISGDLVKELNHSEVENPSKEDMMNESIEIWDLMSSNRMKVQSQSFIAVITTPEGVQAEKVFSVVVGSSRVFQE